MKKRNLIRSFSNNVNYYSDAELNKGEKVVYKAKYVAM